VFDSDRVAEAKARLRTVVEGGQPDRIPFIFSAPVRPKEVTPDLVATDDELALKVQIDRMNTIFEKCPDGDFVPHFTTTELGQAMMPSLFGIEVVVEDNQPPYTVDRIVDSLAQDLEKLPEQIDFDNAGLGPRLRDRVKLFVEATDGQIPVVVADYQSPYGVATKLMPNTALMVAMYDTPDLVHRLFERVTDATIGLIRSMQRWAGDPDLILLCPYVPIPEAGLVIWDDYISVITPALHAEFCRPANMRLYDEFGMGHLHTCGPYFPCFLDSVLGHPGLKSVDIPSYLRKLSKTREDVLELKRCAQEAGVALVANGGLTTSDSERRTWQAPDRDFVRQMAEGGGLIWRSGNEKMLDEHLRWAKDCAA